MMRFVHVGAARVQVLEAVYHDPREVAPLIARLDSLSPELVLVDRAPEEWHAMAAAPSTLAPWEVPFYDAVAAAGDAHPHVVPREVVRALSPHGRAPRAALAAAPRLPRGRKGVKGLLKRTRMPPTLPTGTSAREAIMSIWRRIDDELPDLAVALRHRAVETAAGVVGAARATGAKRLAVLVEVPLGDDVADLIAGAPS